MLPILLAGVFAGAVAVLATLAIERLGGRLGGLIATVPTTIVPAALGLYAASATLEDFRTALYTTPVGMLLNAGFLALWRIVPPRLSTLDSRSRLMTTVAVSVGAWLAVALVVTVSLPALRSTVSPAVLGHGATVVLLAVGLRAARGGPPAPRGRRPVSLRMRLLRGAMAAAAISTAVWLAGVAGPIPAAMVSVFPAVFLTTMVSLWVSQGEAVQLGAVGPMMLGSVSVSAFALLAARTMPAFGPATGAALAWLAATTLLTLPLGTRTTHPSR